MAGRRSPVAIGDDGQLGDRRAPTVGRKVATLLVDRALQVGYRQGVYPPGANWLPMRMRGIVEKTSVQCEYGFEPVVGFGVHLQ